MCTYMYILMLDPKVPRASFPPFSKVQKLFTAERLKPRAQKSDAPSFAPQWTEDRDEGHVQRSVACVLLWVSGFLNPPASIFE